MAMLTKMGKLGRVMMWVTLWLTMSAAMILGNIFPVLSNQDPIGVLCNVVAGQGDLSGAVDADLGIHAMQS